MFVLIQVHIHISAYTYVHSYRVSFAYLFVICSFVRIFIGSRLFMFPISCIAIPIFADFRLSSIFDRHITFAGDNENIKAIIFNMKICTSN